MAQPTRQRSPQAPAYCTREVHQDNTDKVRAKVLSSSASSAIWSTTHRTRYSTTEEEKEKVRTKEKEGAKEAKARIARAR